MKNKVLTYQKNNCYWACKTYQDEELEQIESIEDEDGTIRKRFIIKGLEDGPIFEEPKVLIDAAMPQKRLNWEEFPSISMGYRPIYYTTSTWTTNTATTTVDPNFYYYYTAR